MRMAADKAGFSLLEILIAVVIVGILAGIAISSFRELSDKYRVESETKQLFADLMDARARSIQRNRIFFVRLLANGYETYQDTNTGPDGNGILETGLDTAVVKTDLHRPHGLVQSLPGIIDNTFSFGHGGIASVGSTGFIRISSQHQPDYDCIVIGPTRVKMGQFRGGQCVEK